MSIKDLVELALLIIMTLFTVERWVVSREFGEQTAKKDLLSFTNDLAVYKAQQATEHETIWKEINRHRDRWHKDVAPLLQSILIRLDVFKEHEDGQDKQLSQLWISLDRRRDRQE